MTRTIVAPVLQTGLVIALAAGIAAPGAEARTRRHRSALTTHETLRETRALDASGASAGATTVHRKRMRARVGVALPGLDRSAVAGDSVLRVQIAGWSFETPLSADPRWRPGAKRARFRMKDADAGGGTDVRATWRGGVVRISVESNSAAPIATAALSGAAGPVSTSIDAAVDLAATHVSLGGTADGALQRMSVDSLFETASVSVVGTADVVPDPVVATPPVVTIFTPTPGAVVASGAVVVSGDARDAGAIASLAWSLDGGPETVAAFNVDPTSGASGATRATFSFSVTASPGTHSVQVRARDGSGETGTSDVDFSVPPSDTCATSMVVATVRWGAELVDSQGRVQAWGYYTTIPTVAPGVGPARIADGNLALLDDGTVTTLHGMPVDSSGPRVPVAIANLTDVVDIAQCSATVPNASFAVRSDGSVWAWGDNTYGQLGDGTTTSRYPPVQVQGLPAMRSISAGAYHAVAIARDGGVWTWGGIPGPTDGAIVAPHQVQGLANAAVVSASQFDRYPTGAAVLADGTLWMWGDATSGQLGAAASGRWIPAFHVTGVGRVKSVALGYSHALVLLADGTVLARGGPTSEIWGYWGELGDGTSTPHYDFITVPGLTNVVGVSAGAHTSHALLCDGTLRGWGQNTYGEVGDGTTVDAYSPVVVLPAK